MEEIKQILDQFNAIHLEDLESATLMDRVDTKFAFNRVHAEEIVSTLQLHYKVLEVNGSRIGSYESLYFDEEDFTFYNDHHNNKSHRFKVRFRKYVESDQYFLEVKEKRKGRVKKKRIPVKKFERELSNNSKVFINKQLDTSKDLEPKLWNQYKRVTLVSPNKKERLTLDFELKFGWKDETSSYSDIVIAELKQKRIDRTSPFYVLMKKWNIRPYRVSKYCIGAVDLYHKKEVKYNRFKKKLLKLKKISNAT